ncbi:hypothetical protein I3843_03G028000 [Carya illinoinensis]|uniref:Uncharacterized protein n=1 Tax=Carya illinoinensis TaxID=32201 RepID=A0A8T1QXZ4_CARIL|nr:hypothetical protein CIPAW_03G032000 [Carya illinoinensis]KAG6719825.1 hypothetical protein I3842_03G026500 [Carya illinoinensis]KAG7985487.1 hypothetical protein I3843_03G028000 [Carya illinoinensis]
MNTLQRSNVSFRRQGSSGHIWDDRLFGVLEPRAGNKSSATDKREAENRQRYDRSKEDKRFLFHSTEIAYNSDSPTSSSNSKRQNKVQSCCCCSLLGRCMGSSPTA